MAKPFRLLQKKMSQEARQKSKALARQILEEIDRKEHKTDSQKIVQHKETADTKAC